jgi:hypothetical protein
MSLLLDKDRLHRHTDTLTTATQTERLTTLCRMQGYLGYGIPGLPAEDS